MFPVVDVDPVDQEAAFGDVEVFGFEFVTLPGTDGGSGWVGDGVEAFYTFKMKIVYESYNSTMILMNVAFNKLHSVYVSQCFTVSCTVLHSVF